MPIPPRPISRTTVYGPMRRPVQSLTPRSTGAAPSSTTRRSSGPSVLCVRVEQRLDLAPQAPRRFRTRRRETPPAHDPAGRAPARTAARAVTTIPASTRPRDRHPSLARLQDSHGLACAGSAPVETDTVPASIIYCSWGPTIVQCAWSPTPRRRGSTRFARSPQLRAVTRSRCGARRLAILARAAPFDSGVHALAHGALSERCE